MAEASTEELKVILDELHELARIGSVDEALGRADQLLSRYPGDYDLSFRRAWIVGAYQSYEDGLVAAEDFSCRFDEGDGFYLKALAARNWSRWNDVLLFATEAENLGIPATTLSKIRFEALVGLGMNAEAKEMLASHSELAGPDLAWMVAKSEAAVTEEQMEATARRLEAIGVSGPRIVSYRAQWFSENGRLPDAISELETALKVRDEGALRELLAEYEARQGNYEYAASLWERVVRENSQDRGALSNLCAIYWHIARESNIQNEDDLGRIIGRLEEIDPDVARVHAFKGDWYSHWGKISRAEEEYELAVAAKPNDLQLRYRLAQLKWLQGKRQESFNLYEDCLALDSERNTIVRFLMTRYLLERRWRNALKLLKKLHH